MLTFCDLLFTLKDFFLSKGCIYLNSFDMEVGAATFHPVMFFDVLDGKQSSLCYTQSCRRPVDGRFGNHPLRTFKHNQFQALFISQNIDLLQFFTQSLIAININHKDHDIQFLQDDWSSPGLGASGKGWECRIDGLEIAQITYFNKMGGKNVIAGEIAYGMERICLILQDKYHINDINYYNNRTYGDLFAWQEYDLSESAFKNSNKYSISDIEHLGTIVEHLIENNLFLSAYENIVKMHNIFNLLDVSMQIKDKRKLILKIRDFSIKLASKYKQ